ncbi:Alpha-ketoglutarate-dependent dioxygenase AlkB-like [Arabidopsis suecica]|uniref:DNA N(6)-methyladenine demethylase n=1 Tax=Arabidopsis suecica TaxID=45249 RepID=A0A8T1Z423_ARASU|nr:Alpha-ketoglutarate-dependent dioxygenase AlkB-like [Arabidopsis suecica]
MMKSLYHSFSLTSRHQILLRMYSPSARKIMSSSPIRKTQTTSFESLNDYDEQFPPLTGGSKKKKVSPTSETNFGCKHRDQGTRRSRASRSLDEEANVTTFEVAAGTGSRTSVVELDSTNPSSPSKSSQSHNLKIRKVRNHRNSGFKSRVQSPKRKEDPPFDICSSVIERNDTSINDWALADETNGETVEVSNKHRVLRPGMVLLKDFLTHDIQVDIVKTCRELGVKPAGFYQPGYRVGSKLHLQMMCLGRNWDPQTKYSKNTDIDSKAPDIPVAFSVLVEEAIREAHALIDRESGTEDAERILPVMSPDICIVNFYSESGRLGLHQDRDESQESIGKGLPIVSFSIGDSAEFLYGEKRDVEEAEGVILESGDVLIFGGECRMMFHGVKSIIPNSAPMSLLNESKLRTGRLNLTFRHF